MNYETKIATTSHGSNAIDHQRDLFVYLTMPPQARPFLEPQSAIERELEKEGLSESYKMYLIEKDIEMAKAISENTPPDQRPYMRHIHEILVLCAIGGIFLISIKVRR